MRCNQAVDFTVENNISRLLGFENQIYEAGDHESDNSITVAPNKTKQITWHFHGQNKVVFACNIAGHAESGMVKKITL